MKNPIRILSVFILFALISTSVSGQTSKDSLAVLQKCMELKDLQQYLPLNSDGTMRQIYILQGRITFPSTTNVQIAGNKAELVDFARLEKLTDPYYIQFWDFRISQDKASAGFMLNSRPGRNTVELLRVVVEAVKSGTDWVINDTKITRVQ